MAELYIKQALMYSKVRPSYPEELFNFITPKTPFHDLVWDVGTGSGQAAKSVSLSFLLSYCSISLTSSCVTVAQLRFITMFY